MSCSQLCGHIRDPFSCFNWLKPDSAAGQTPSQWHAIKHVCTAIKIRIAGGEEKSQAARTFSHINERAISKHCLFVITLGKHNGA